MGSDLFVKENMLKENFRIPDWLSTSKCFGPESLSLCLPLTAPKATLTRHVEAARLPKSRDDSQRLAHAGGLRLPSCR